MITITLPDGSKREFPQPVTVAEVAALMRVSKMTVYRLVHNGCLLYTSPSPRDRTRSRMPSSA